MNRVSTPKRMLVCCALLALVAMPFAQAASPIAGDWAITIDFGGAKVPAGLIINEGDGGALSGTLNSPQGEMVIEVVTFDGTTVGFDQEVDMAGTPMQFKFEGKVDGDTFVGTLASDMGEMAVEGKRGGAGGIAGTWNLVSDSQLGVLERVLTVNDDLSGTYASEDAEFSVENLTEDGDAITFDVTLEAQGQELPLSFVGKLDGDALAGDFMMDGGSVATVTATRAGGDVTALLGKWAIEADSPLGLLEHTLTVSADGAKYDQEGEISELSVKLDGNAVSFPLNIQGYDVVFEGTVDGDNLTGNFNLDGEPVAPVVAKRSN